MAEGAEKSCPSEGDGEGPSAGVADTLPLRQSKSSSESFLDFGELEGAREGKNRVYLVCKSCRCKVLKPGYATLVQREIFLPSMTEKYRIGSEPSGDKLTDFWLVVDMYHFENVGFSKTVDQTVKYLICADCERGPIGWHSITNKNEFLVSGERVQYSTT